MTERSHAGRRAARLVEREFPARPTLFGSGRCDGMAFVLRAGTPLPDLRPIRDSVRAIWRGTLSDSEDASCLVVVVFVAPLRVDAEVWPAALPLVASSATTLASFARDGSGEPRPPADPRRVELWWGGRVHRIALETLAPISRATLWDMPRLTVHQPTNRPRAAAERIASGDTSTVAPVSRAAIPLTRDGADLLRDTNQRLRAAEERTRLSAIARQAFDKLRHVRLIGIGGEGSTSIQPDQPGLLANLAGWIRWRTPLGNGLRAQYDQRLSEVEKRIGAGDIDGALRLALKLGRATTEKSRNYYPNALPEARARLDFDLAGEGFSAPILWTGTFFQLRSRYLQLAEQLERDGDFRRAAYIHSQLLSDHRRAVLVLEKGKLFQEAAKLAIDGRQEPELAIRMLFFAGDTDAALALAKRTACFDALAEDSRKADPVYHAYVLKAWTDILLATGQPLRALQVTDTLAEAPAADTALLDQRRTWLHAAIEIEGNGVDAELAIRAMLTARWDGEDLPADGADAFPHATLRGSDVLVPPLSWLQAVLRGEPDCAASQALDLLGHLSRLSTPDSPEQAGFWAGPAQPLLEGFARALVATAASRLASRDLQMLQSVLAHAHLTVLAADIGKLAKLYVPKATSESKWQVPPAPITRPAIRRACLLGNGTMLVWRESRLLQLLDRDGAPLWQQNVSDVTALVAIGSSPNVVVVQAQQDGTSLLTRFASHARTFHPIGRLPLTAHHDITSESQWLVQIGGEIGALDLVKLCAPSPAIEFLWSCALTDRLRVIAFAHQPHGPSWITRDISPERSSVLEIWSLRSNGQLTTSVCLPARREDLTQPPPPQAWCWTVQQGLDRLSTTGIGKDQQGMQVSPWSEGQEEQARIFAASRARAGLLEADTVQPCDYGRPFIDAVDNGDGDGGLHIFLPDSPAPSLALTVNAAEAIGLSCVVRGGFTPDSKAQASDRVALLADDRGRLFHISLDDLRVRIF